MSERVLVLGDDLRAFLAVVRSLGRHGLEVHVAPSDFASPALESRYIAAIHRLPDYAPAPEAWEEALRSLIAEHDFRLVVPCGDSSLVRLDHHGDSLGRERLALPNREAFAAFTDKARTRELARRLGVAVADGKALGPEEEAPALAARYGLPLLLKPRQSHRVGEAFDKRSARIVRNVAELEQALVSGAAEDCLVERFVPGVGVGLSVIARNGRLVRAYQHRRLHQTSETGASSSRISEPVDPALLRSVEKLAGAVALDGVAMFEFRCDRRSGRHALLEVNPRFWGSLPLALAAGADFPALLYRMIGGEALEPDPGYRTGLVRRDFTGEYERLVLHSEGDAPPAERLGAACSAILVPILVRPRSIDSWAADDPAPFRAEWQELTRRIATAALKRLPLPRRLKRWRIAAAPPAAPEPAP